MDVTSWDNVLLVGRLLLTTLQLVMVTYQLRGIWNVLQSKSEIERSEKFQVRVGRVMIIVLLIKSHLSYTDDLEDP